jgi:hypothetical protein
VKLDQARAFALSLPETTEDPHFDLSSFRVNKKIFCTIPPDGKTLRIFVGSVFEVQGLVAEDPAAFDVIIWGKREVSDWVSVHLPKASAPQVKELLEDAWRAKAPKRALKALEERS